MADTPNYRRAGREIASIRERDVIAGRKHRGGAFAARDRFSEPSIHPGWIFAVAESLLQRAIAEPGERSRRSARLSD